ncbi:MlaD family protein [Nocardia stercoris]|uniref:MCE family protein n=1 Tax=Nocardia stercoris TaxID=2483361 RepID=A0A3M2L2J8_9NOCA|nr:MlaD family protein [Nocardia stercoris]RMI30045.1 MCE family protein [Nocardia stercoris]
MPVYALPGTAIGPRGSRILGTCAIVLAVAAGAGWKAMPHSAPADRIDIALVVDHVGEGIAAGTDVRLDGVRVGTVSAVDLAARGTRRIELALRRSQLFGLTDAVTADYAPGNLFGISTLDLHANPGGTELREGTAVDLTGAAANRVADATLSALLTSTGKLTDDVLTPQLTEVLRQVSHDVTAFTPLLQAIGATVRAAVETQQLPPSYLLDRFGSALTGLPSILTGGLTILKSDYENKYLASPDHIRDYGGLWVGVQDQLLPVLKQLLDAAQPEFGDLVPVAAAPLRQVAAAVSTPQRSAGQLSELLDRVGRSFHDTPDGPVVDADVNLDVVPGLAGPLAALLGSAPGPALGTQPEAATGTQPGAAAGAQPEAATGTQPAAGSQPQAGER